MSSLVIDEATERSVALRGALAERIVIADGAMGTMLQAYDLTAIVIHHPAARYFSV